MTSPLDIYEEFNRPEDEDEFPRRSIRKLLKLRADYRHGPVKHYTKEEINEYERTHRPYSV